MVVSGVATGMYCPRSLAFAAPMPGSESVNFLMPVPGTTLTLVSNVNPTASCPPERHPKNLDRYMKRGTSRRMREGTLAKSAPGKATSAIWKTVLLAWLITRQALATPYKRTHAMLDTETLR